jgi:cytoskeleton protein RodZ
MSVGKRLRQARLDTELSISQVADRTKIQHWILEAIERDDMPRVPGGIFARGYLAAFARAVGLDPQQIVAEHFGHDPVPVVLPPMAEPRARRREMPSWQIAVIVCAAVVLAIMWWTRPRPVPGMTTTRIAAPVRSTTQEPKPAATAGATPSSAPVDQREHEQNHPATSP